MTDPEIASMTVVLVILVIFAAIGWANVALKSHLISKLERELADAKAEARRHRDRWMEAVDNTRQWRNTAMDLAYKHKIDRGEVIRTQLGNSMIGVAENTSSRGVRHSYSKPNEDEVEQGKCEDIWSDSP